MIKELIMSYRINKCKEIGMELDIVLQDDIPIYQCARRLSKSEQKKVNI